MPAPYATHRAQIKAILTAWGMPEENAEPTADIMSWADLHGVDSHGMSMLPGYDRLRRTGRAKMDARPKIVKETPIAALVDGLKPREPWPEATQRAAQCPRRSPAQCVPAPVRQPYPATTATGRGG